jgi:transcriptional regulator with XRE-family HTH domain
MLSFHWKHCCQWKPIDSLHYNQSVPSARDPEALYRVFGRRLRVLREGKGMPQQELATLSGLTRSSIANIESGKQRVLLHQVLQFAEALHVTVPELMLSTEDLPRLRTTEAANEKHAYAEKLRKMAAVRSDDGSA